MLASDATGVDPGSYKSVLAAVTTALNDIAVTTAFLPLPPPYPPSLSRLHA